VCFDGLAKFIPLRGTQFAVRDRGKPPFGSRCAWRWRSAIRRRKPQSKLDHKTKGIAVADACQTGGNEKTKYEKGIMSLRSIGGGTRVEREL
jgi:hypothetical protein